MRSLRTSSRAIAVVMALVISISVSWSWREGERNIRSDVEGYWAYLRAVFITHDLGHEPTNRVYVNETEGGTLNKCFVGESVMLLPFFLAAHATAHVFGYDTDGYSLPYQRSIHFAAWTYLLIGLLCFRALLVELGVRDGTITTLILVLGLGTQLLNFSALRPGWTHVYSFCAIGAFLLAVRRMAGDHHVRGAVLSAVFLGLIILIRPTNGLVLLAIPMVHGSETLAVLGRLLHRPALLVACMAVTTMIVFVQPLLWYAQTGHWYQHGYKGEGFYWLDPMFLQVLFGMRNGLFIWTPVMIAAAFGVFALWRRDRIRAGSVLVYWVAVTYIISSWWSWYFGGGFGHRAFIDHYAIFLIPLGLWLDRASLVLRRSAIAFLAIASGWHIIQFGQYHNGILHDVKMDGEKYAWAFLRFGDKDRLQFGGNDQVQPYHPNGMSLVVDEHCNFEQACGLWQAAKVEERATLGRSTSNVCVLDSTTDFGATVTLAPGTLPTGRMAHLVVDMERYEPYARSSHDMQAVLSVETPDGSPRYYEATRMNPLPGERDGEWRHIHYEIPISVFLRNDDRVLFYIWNRHRGELFLDDLRVQVWTVNHY